MQLLTRLENDQLSRKRTRKSFASVEILSTAAQLCKNYTQNFFRVDSSDASLLKRLSTDDPWNQSHREWRHSCNDVLSRFDIGLVQLWRTNTYKTIIMYRVSTAASRGKNVTATSMSTCANVVKSCRNRKRHTRRQSVFSPVRLGLAELVLICSIVSPANLAKVRSYASAPAIYIMHWWHKNIIYWK